MGETSEKSSALPNVSTQTIKGLQGMEAGLNQQKDKISGLKDKQAEQLSDMQELGDGLKEMGENLTSISENLNTMLTYSDTMKPGLPQSQTTLEYMVYEDGKLRDMFSELIIDDQYMTMVIKFEGGVRDESKSEIVASIQSYLESESLDKTETMVSGKPVLDDSIRTSMKESMQKMLMLSILFMILVLSLVFKVKWRILPLVIILVALVGTVGLMGWTGIPITMVSMAVFPILIGLGIDYAIQFQSRYTEEMMEGDTNNE
jgi:predicted RND superfamily exporter protein